MAFTYVSAASRDTAQALARELEADGRRARAIQADSADPAQVRRAVEQAIGELGPVDVLVNNAGIFLAGPLDEVTLEDYDRTMNINVRAPFVAIQAAQAAMPDGGRIINIGSCLAERSGRAGVTLYSASKSALLGMTRGVARDLGARGITANGGYHPGPIDFDTEPGCRRARGRPGGGAVVAALRRSARHCRHGGVPGRSRRTLRDGREPGGGWRVRGLIRGAIPSPV